METGFFWLGLGLAALGYFIGDGLKNFKNPKGNVAGYPHLIKERDLQYYLGLSKEETKEMLHKYPDIPKIELKGTTYYPYQHLMEWMSSADLYQN
ncbi:DNA-binding protein [Bacillus swezeyi]|uniref:DNA-binding protein n=1 Tax=Bacillus swezeyi TaxID=1925020 RepID=A0A1R1QA06_9BACI|nr:DNA-binding protein [Bacillus swezeyi]MEC1262953.1 DNA-binding protein [Bacillus swezeyi]MEC1263119.1 DNA-binding protein [Bacillus swezeyi]MED1742241.1 DNA-binding protein [Bacillus swezeyi]MED2930016.1 DNA-binding protein [Bacillus swezeyi]MED2944922.1 DNA-binding protein [Bacillus swezeyi]